MDNVNANHLTKAIKDLDRTIGRIARILEHSNDLEVSRLRDIQVQNKLHFEGDQ